MKNINDLKRTGMDLKPAMLVGKSGITEGIENEIDSQLERTELIKVKFLRSAGPSSSWKDDIEALIGRIGAKLIEIKGGTVLIYRPKRR
ncbi:MAG: YhbY family RNA-binding protein [Thermoplasmatota archaeon]